MRLRIFLFFSLLARGALFAKLTQQEKDDVLNKHNELRRNEGASNMAQLVWNCGIEKKAQEHADKCFYDHSTKEFRNYDSGEGTSTPKGENLATHYQIGGTDKTFNESIQSWYDEKSGYVLNTTACNKRPCGHYTQVVWANSVEIGCARVKCNPLKNVFDGDKHAWFEVCQYGPAGNYVSQRPYTKGVACSACAAERANCCQGLCSKEASSQCKERSKAVACGESEASKDDSGDNGEKSGVTSLGHSLLFSRILTCIISLKLMFF